MTIENLKKYEFKEGWDENELVKAFYLHDGTVVTIFVYPKKNRMMVLKGFYAPAFGSSEDVFREIFREVFDFSEVANIEDFLN